MKFNPFTNIIETNEYPHARTLRTNFWTKWKDSWSVIYGDNKTGEGRAGIFDYFTLFIPMMLNRLEVWLEKTNSSFFAAVTIFNMLHQIPRGIFSFFAVLIATPVTLAVAGIARVIDNWSDSNLDVALETQNSEGSSLRDFINHGGHRLLREDPLDRIESLETEIHPDGKQVTIFKPKIKGGRHYFFSEPTDEQKTAILTHNIGQVRYNSKGLILLPANEDQLNQYLNNEDFGRAGEKWQENGVEFIYLKTGEHTFLKFDLNSDPATGEEFEVTEPETLQKIDAFYQNISPNYRYLKGQVDLYKQLSNDELEAFENLLPSQTPSISL